VFAELTVNSLPGVVKLYKWKLLVTSKVHYKFI